MTDPEGQDARRRETAVLRSPTGASVSLQKIRTFLLAVIALVCLGFILAYAKNVILPFLVAFFAMILLSPVVVWLRGRGVPSWIAVPAALFTLALMLLAIGLAFFLNLEPMIEAGPRYQESGGALLGRITARLEGWGISEERMRDLLADEEQDGPPSAAPVPRRDLQAVVFDKVKQNTGALVSFTTGGVTSFVSFVGQCILVLLYLLFMLFEATRFHEKAEQAFGARSPVFDTIGAISRDVKVYVIWKTIISLVTGLLTALVCWLFGVDFPLFWGTMAFGLNYIPNLGSVVASLLPCGLVLVQFENPWLRAVGLLVTLVVMQNVMGSLIEPRLMGRSLSISPLLLLLSLVFWGWLWGVVGMILAVPIAVTIKIICHHTPGLDPVAKLFES